ncbi:hypothetical protein BCR34DRAFT_601527 [Clohesyomyces aquaticus]|uniref:Uncharacterized protein n=1 Tax=Clohesyomyces aquaticus TaxID=1231657 RepID=A0A1Y1ZLY9_9PLEO|nr:hypothetical protein BCR34DRAFT_601527 [Clohesyomyces aquaticus]
MAPFIMDNDNDIARSAACVDHTTGRSVTASPVPNPATFDYYTISLGTQFTDDDNDDNGGHRYPTVDDFGVENAAVQHDLPPPPPPPSPKQTPSMLLNPSPLELDVIEPIMVDESHNSDWRGAQSSGHTGGSQYSSSQEDVPSQTTNDPADNDEADDYEAWESQRLSVPVDYFNNAPSRTPSHHSGGSMMEGLEDEDNVEGQATESPHSFDLPYHPYYNPRTGSGSPRDL